HPAPSPATPGMPVPESHQIAAKSSSPAAASEVQSRDASKAANSNQTFEVSGKVVGPNDKPCSGARMFICRPCEEPPYAFAGLEWIERGKTDADGRFRFSLSTQDRPAGRPMCLAATSEEFGLVSVELDNKHAL